MKLVATNESVINIRHYLNEMGKKIKAYKEKELKKKDKDAEIRIEEKEKTIFTIKTKDYEHILETRIKEDNKFVNTYTFKGTKEKTKNTADIIALRELGNGKIRVIIDCNKDGEQSTLLFDMDIIQIEE